MVVDPREYRGQQRVTDCWLARVQSAATRRKQNKRVTIGRGPWNFLSTEHEGYSSRVAAIAAFVLPAFAWVWTDDARSTWNLKKHRHSSPSPWQWADTGAEFAHCQLRDPLDGGGASSSITSGAAPSNYRKLFFWTTQIWVKSHWPTWNMFLNLRRTGLYRLDTTQRS